MTQQQLADTVGVSVRSVKSWEASHVPSHRVPAVKAALGVEDERAPASVAEAALDKAVGSLVDEHGGRQVLGSLVRVWRE